MLEPRREGADLHQSDVTTSVKLHAEHCIILPGLPTLSLAASEMRPLGEGQESAQSLREMRPA